MEISILWLITVVLFVLKVTGLITISWWWVAAPFIISVLFALIMTLIVGRTFKSLWAFRKRKHY